MSTVLCNYIRIKKEKNVCDEFGVVLDLILLHFECTSCVQFMKKILSIPSFAYLIYFLSCYSV